MSASGTYPTSSRTISSYFCHRIISLRTWLFCLASTSSLTSAAAVVNRTRRFCRQAARHADLPWEGVPVRIELRVRRFFCRTDGCSQRIFTERLPNTVGRHGRRTCRLSSALDRITLALGGSAGARLAKQLGIVADGSTLLLGLRQRTRPAPSSSPRVVGIDDWAWRKGQRYGTILCDLERAR